MADDEQLRLLRSGVEQWNAWRSSNPGTRIDLSEADLREATLSGADLRRADLSWAHLGRAGLRRADLSEAVLYNADLREANLSPANLHKAILGWADLSQARLSLADLSEANLYMADLHGADLREATFLRAKLQEANLSRADLHGADLSEANCLRADLREADLTEARLTEADLRGANLRGADLTRADLRFAMMVGTQLNHAVLMDCNVYGVSAWNVELGGARQANLSISNVNEPTITTDSLEVAQFLYLMLHNAKIRDIIDTLTSKVVLILGRFTPARKRVLDAIREELRKHNYVPVLFDFEGPTSHNYTETVTLLARMARFIIADLTEPSSIPKELEAIVPTVHVPVQPVIAEGFLPFAMFPDYRLYPWMLKLYRYASLEELIASIGPNVIEPAEAKVIELRKLRLADDERDS